MQQHVVRSGEVRLAVREHGAAGRPTVVLVHGFPDTQAVWDPVVARLSEKHGLAVVTYDVRGAGKSSAPTSRNGYRTERLVDDLVAVIDQVAPASRVHLVGHDWGSVQLWDAVTTADRDQRLRGRIASFTSISGPSLDHAAHFVRRGWRERDWRPLLRQASRSWYVCVFLLPVLPELMWQRGAPLLRRKLVAVERLGEDAHWGPTLGRDGANGVNLYRANVPSRMAHAGAGRTEIPVQVVIPRHDAFITPAVFDDLRSFAPGASMVEIDGGHWVMRQQPEQVARLIADHVRAHDGG